MLKMVPYPATTELAPNRECPSQTLHGPRNVPSCCGPMSASEINLSLDLLVNFAGEGTEPRRDVDPVTVDARVLRRTSGRPELDPNSAILHAPLWIQRRIALRHTLLNCHRAVDGVEHAGGTPEVFHRLPYRSPCCGSQIPGLSLEVTSHAKRFRLLVRPHQTAVARDIGCE